MQKVKVTIVITLTIVLGLLMYDSCNPKTISVHTIYKCEYEAFCKSEGIEYVPYIQWGWLAFPDKPATIYKKVRPITGWVHYDFEP
jgi:hypothetical protein